MRIIANDNSIRAIANRKRKTEQSRTKFYSDAIKKLRPLIAGFDTKDGYDLRKPQKLTKARKARISRTLKELAAINRKGSAFIKFNKRKNESESKYLKRLAKINKQYGNTIKNGKFILVDSFDPRKQKARIKNGILEIEEIKQGEPDIIERFYAFEPENMVKDPDKELKKIYRKVNRSKFNAIQYQMIVGLNRLEGIDNQPDFTDIVKAFLNQYSFNKTLIELFESILVTFEA